MTAPASIGRASRRWEASTAYGCALRGVAFDAATERKMWGLFVGELASYWPCWRCPRSD